jgi:hypothetical protein
LQWELYTSLENEKPKTKLPLFFVEKIHRKHIKRAAKAKIFPARSIHRYLFI